MHELIAAPYLDHHLLVRPGNPKAARLPVHRYEELRTAPGTSTAPTWLADVARRAWEIDLSGRRLEETVLARSRSPYGYGRASYELNLGCEHCYLGLKQFAGRDWPDRERLLHAIRVPHVRQRTGLRRIRFHDLRRSTATLLLEQGVDLVVIKELLGHAHIGVYAHDSDFSGTPSTP